MSATIIRVKLEGAFEMRNGLDEIVPCVVSITRPAFEKGIIGVRATGFLASGPCFLVFGQIDR